MGRCSAAAAARARERTAKTPKKVIARSEAEEAASGEAQQAFVTRGRNKDRRQASHVTVPRGK